MFEHISPERKTGHHSETTGIILLGVETIYILQVMIQKFWEFAYGAKSVGMNLLAPPKIGKIDQCSFHIEGMLPLSTPATQAKGMLQYDYFEGEYAICSLVRYSGLFLFVLLLSHSCNALACAHLLYFYLFLIFLSFMYFLFVT